LVHSEKSQSSLLSKSFKIALALAIAVAPLQIWHLSAEQVYKYQPENWRQWRHSGTQFHLEYLPTGALWHYRTIKPEND